MLELTESQLQQLRQREHRDFVERVRAEIVQQFPDADRDGSLRQRLEAAHDLALRIGLESATARTQFLYQEAFAPGFHEQPAIRAWLKRPGADIEQRWRDFMALAGARLGGK